MNKNRKYAKELLNTFVYVFGLMQIKITNYCCTADRFNM